VLEVLRHETATIVSQLPQAKSLKAEHVSEARAATFTDFGWS
jgi:hypothetical protein